MNKKIIIVIMLIVIAAAFLLATPSSTDITTDILNSKNCKLNSSNFNNPYNEKDYFEIEDTASSTKITFIQNVDDSMYTTFLDSVHTGKQVGEETTIAGIKGVLVQNEASNSLTFVFSANDTYYSLEAVALDGTSSDNILISNPHGLSVIAQFNDLLTAWKN